RKAALLRLLRRDLRRSSCPVPTDSLDFLVEEAERAIERYLETPRALRPSEVSRQLTLLSRHLTNAAGVAKELRGQGWLIMTAASSAGAASSDADFTPHVLYLERLAAWSVVAAEVAEGLADSAQDHRGG